MLKFDPVTLDDQQSYIARLNDTTRKQSDYSFVNIWGWAEEYGLEWRFDDDLVWIRQTSPDILYWAPAGGSPSTAWENRLAPFIDEGAEFIRIPESIAEMWKPYLKDRYELSEARDHWDYLYDVRELADLKGKRFHKKKNLLNQFKKNYHFLYKPFNLDITGQALEMQDSWCEWKDCESSDTLSSENRVIQRILQAWEQLPALSGGALFADNRLIAFTVAEQIAESMLLIHFEKGLTEYKGVYQAINQMFLETNRAFEYVNREQDLGDEGLRKAKMSYNPFDFIKKYEFRRL